MKDIMKIKKSLKIQKRGENTFFKNSKGKPVKYYILSDIKASIQKALQEYNIEYLITFQIDKDKQIENSNIEIYTYKYNFYRNDEEWIYQIDAPMSRVGKDANQDFGKSVTYNTRYGWQALFELYDETTEPDSNYNWRKEKPENQDRLLTQTEIEHLRKHLKDNLKKDRKGAVEFLGFYGYNSTGEVKYQDYINMLKVNK